MASYLDRYGVADVPRERRNKRILLGSLTVLIVGTAGYFLLRNWREERSVDQFIALLRDKNYQGAYQRWGCKPETPCSHYPPEKFMQDWGPEGIYKNAAAMKIEDVDACDTGVVFNVNYPGSEPFGLWVERGTEVMSFAPWPRCPGRHLQIMEFLKSRFGGGKGG